MTTKMIEEMYADVKAAMAKVADADKYAKSFDGAYSIIVKLWDTKGGSGYKEAAKTLLGEEFTKPSSLKKYLTALRRGEAVSALYVRDENGNRVHEKDGKKELKEFQIGLWKTVKVVDEDVTIVGRDGKDVHPYKKDSKGAIMTREELRAVRTWTPKTIFEVIVQDLAYSASERALKELETKYIA